MSYPRFLYFISCATIVASTIFPAIADSASDAQMAKMQHDSIVGGGPWHYHSVPCVDGVVKLVGPRLSSAGQTHYTHADFVQSGVSVEVKLIRKTSFILNVPRTLAGVTHYQDDYDNNLMEAERVGDKVQVCLMSFPTPTVDPTSGAVQCDPDQDGRGWQFRIYDYRKHAAYYGSETEHTCGGA
jgi:hypothetical protein